MCVIFAMEEGERPTVEMLEKGWERNPEGAGAAWLDFRRDENGDVLLDDLGHETVVVRWKKGLTLDEAKELNKTLPFPYVLHFRVASADTSKRRACCHPFPISADVPLDLEGETTSGVLFHNGHWTNWKEKVINSAMANGFTLPSDSWSDSRAMAWSAHYIGMGFCELVNEKIAVLSPLGLELFGTGWEREGKVWCSNTYWKSATYTPVRDQRRSFDHGGSRQLPSGSGSNSDKKEEDTTKNNTTGGASNAGTGGSPRIVGFRSNGAGHPRSVQSGEDQQKANEEAAQAPQAGAGEAKAASDRKADAPLTADGGAATRFHCGVSARVVEIGKRIVNDPETGPCCECGSTKLGWIYEGKRYCTQCFPWTADVSDDSERADSDEANPPGIAETEHKCEFCQKRQGIAMRDDDLRWICGPCWINRGRPKLASSASASISAIHKHYDDARLSDRRRLRARGITVMGPM